jgi:putative ABC transport system permease protein
MSAFGGAIGIMIAWIIGKIMTAVFFPTLLSLWAIVVTIVVSGGIGVVAGVFPAWKAARLDPIEALRAD